MSESDVALTHSRLDMVLSAWNSFRVCRIVAANQVISMIGGIQLSILTESLSPMRNKSLRGLQERLIPNKIRIDCNVGLLFFS